MLDWQVAAPSLREARSQPGVGFYSLYIVCSMCALWTAQSVECLGSQFSSLFVCWATVLSALCTEKPGSALCSLNCTICSVPRITILLSILCSMFLLCTGQTVHQGVGSQFCSLCVLNLCPLHRKILKYTLWPVFDMSLNTSTFHRWRLYPCVSIVCVCFICTKFCMCV